jgi:hypothetical protein
MWAPRPARRSIRAGRRKAVREADHQSVAYCTVGTTPWRMSTIPERLVFQSRSGINPLLGETVSG